MKTRRILHPSDFSSASRAAFGKALEIAKTEGAELVLIHVTVPVSRDGGSFVPSRVYEDLRRWIRTDALGHLDKLLAQARSAGVRARPLVVDGAPVERIVRAARAHHADLIVMGTHGQSGLKRLLLGSVAERVAGTAHCPVLTVRG